MRQGTSIQSSTYRSKGFQPNASGRIIAMKPPACPLQWEPAVSEILLCLSRLRNTPLLCWACYQHQWMPKSKQNSRTYQTSVWTCLPEGSTGNIHFSGEASPATGFSIPQGSRTCSQSLAFFSQRCEAVSWIYRWGDWMTTSCEAPNMVQTCREKLWNITISKEAKSITTEIIYQWTIPTAMLNHQRVCLIFQPGFRLRTISDDFGQEDGCQQSLNSRCSSNCWSFRIFFCTFTGWTTPPEPCSDLQQRHSKVNLDWHMAPKSRGLHGLNPSRTRKH